MTVCLQPCTRSQPSPIHICANNHSGHCILSLTRHSRVLHASVQCKGVMKSWQRERRRERDIPLVINHHAKAHLHIHKGRCPVPQCLEAKDMGLRGFSSHPELKLKADWKPPAAPWQTFTASHQLLQVLRGGEELHHVPGLFFRQFSHMLNGTACMCQSITHATSGLVLTLMKIWHTDYKLSLIDIFNNRGLFMQSITQLDNGCTCLFLTMLLRKAPLYLIICISC